MTDMEKALCQMVLDNGFIERVATHTTDKGESQIQWDVRMNGELYTLTKLDGEWIYFFHYIGA